MSGPPVAGDVKASQARNFDTLNEVLGATSFDTHLRFLNYGYALLPGEEPVGPTIGPLFPNADAARMLFQLVGDLSLDGLDVVDVGCGRGGNLWLLGRHHHPRLAVGLDVAASSVQLVGARVPTARGVVGDAERLPLADGSVDVVLSVEYPRAELDPSEVRDAVDVLSFYADKYVAQITELSAVPEA